MITPESKITHTDGTSRYAQNLKLLGLDWHVRYVAKIYIFVNHFI